MNVRSFVALCGVVLSCWLAVTYVRPVSEKHYPLLGKRSGGEVVRQGAMPAKQAKHSGTSAEVADVPLMAGTR